MEAKYNFQYSADQTEITLFDFKPNNQETFENFVKNNKFERLYYFQNDLDSNLGGKIYSYIYYGKNLNIKYSLTNDNNFVIEKGIPKNGFDQLKQFAINLNKDEIIFPMNYIHKFKKNSLDIKKSDLSIQIYLNNEIIGHASVIKTTNPLIKDENLFLLMRFLIHEDFRRTDVKEILLREIANYLPPESSLFLQVFPKNTIAINFFKKRLLVNLAYTKMLISHD